MNKNEANEMRLIAAQIIYDLWRNGEVEQLHMLVTQARSSIQDLKDKEEDEIT